ncbi:trypsin-like peptidase domain-containing protein [Thioclava sp. FR2]|uniref:trypsin-like peptidase domain-containing protein n=1 Tax=Thioclava sp. FR2 TaxID=3445780 RepID=UPI003EB71C1B
MKAANRTVFPFHRNAIRFRAHRYFLEMLAALVVLTSVAALSPARAAEVTPGVMVGAMEKVLVVRSADNADRFLGSAFLWGESAEVAVTAAHVVGKAGEVRLVDSQGREEVGVVIARDEVRDVALVALGEGFRGRAGFLLAGLPELGQSVWALGAPLGLEFTLTKGQVSSEARQVQVGVPILMVQHDAAVNPGSSGGPLVDAEGRLVGMNTRIADGSRMFVGIAYAISAEDLGRIVPLLIAEELLPFPKMEFRMRPIDKMIAAALGVSEGGLLIEDVTVGGMAERSGLKPGDVVLAIDGVVIEEPGMFAFLIEAAQSAKGEADFALLRAGQAVLVTVVFAEHKEVGLLERNAPGSEAARKASYRVESLGLELGDGGRIAKLLENSPALWAGLVEGDRILSVNGVVYDTTALRALELTEPAIVLVQGRNGRTRHVVLDPWNTAAGLRPVGDANVLDPAVVVF